MTDQSSPVSAALMLVLFSFAQQRNVAANTEAVSKCEAEIASMLTFQLHERVNDRLDSPSRSLDFSTLLFSHLFSSELVRLIFESLARSDEGKLDVINEKTLPTTYDAIRFLKDRLQDQDFGEYPNIPVVGRTSEKISFELFFEDDPVRTDQPTDENEDFFWGRVRIDRLLNFLSEFGSWPIDKLQIDLAPPIRPLADLSSRRDLENLLDLAASSTISARAAIVDLGEKDNSGEANFHQNVNLVSGTDVKFSSHSASVLEVLSERLQGNGILPNTELYAALVVPPNSSTLGNSALDQAGSVELLNEFKSLVDALPKDGIPTGINISLGTHIGPHDGSTPMEQYLSKVVGNNQNWFLCTAAGNEDGLGQVASRDLTAGFMEHLSLDVAGACKDLLIEFWWKSDPVSPIDVSIEAKLTIPRQNRRDQVSSVSILPTSTLGPVLQSVSGGLPGKMTCSALYQKAGSDNMRCIAFAIGKREGLPDMEVLFEIVSAGDVCLNGWIVLGDGANETRFVDGGQSAAICVPATCTSSISVAGAVSKNQMWRFSSRGPAYTYSGSGHLPKHAPTVAHNVAGPNGEEGTSFASPRACADCLSMLTNNAASIMSMSPVDLILATYKPGTGHIPKWSKRYGYHIEL